MAFIGDRIGKEYGSFPENKNEPIEVIYLIPALVSSAGFETGTSQAKSPHKDQSVTEDSKQKPLVALCMS